MVSSNVYGGPVVPKIVSNALSVIKIKNLKQGRYLDGQGLYLTVQKSGAKSWSFKYNDRKGKTREMGLGPYQAIPLAEARKRATQYRLMILDGFDPIEERNMQREANAPKDKPTVGTFKELAERYIKNNEDGWKSPVNRQQWKQTLNDYVYPIIGDMPVSEIDFDAVSKVLMQHTVNGRAGREGPIWVVKHPTATNVRSRIHLILRKPVRD